MYASDTLCHSARTGESGLAEAAMLTSASRVSRRVIVPSQSKIQCIGRVGSEKRADAMFEHVLGYLLQRLVAAENVILRRPRSGCNIQLGLQWLEIIRNIDCG